MIRTFPPSAGLAAILMTVNHAAGQAPDTTVILADAPTIVVFRNSPMSPPADSALADYGDTEFRQAVEGARLRGDEHAGAGRTSRGRRGAREA